MKLRRILPETIFAIITLFCCAVAFSCFFKSHVMDKKVGKALGTVVRVDQDDKSTSKTGTYFPVIHFTTATGQEIEQRSTVGMKAANYKEGQKVPVVYDKDNPLLFQINSWWEMYILPIVFGVVGVVLGVFTLMKVIFKVQRIASRRGAVAAASSAPASSSSDS